MSLWYVFLKDIQWKLNRRGLLGKRNQLKYVLKNYPVISDSKNMLFNQRNMIWKEKRKEIKKAYRKIKLYYMHSTRIGEYTSEFLAIIEDVERDKKNEVLDVFILLDTVNMNKRLINIISRNICIINETNIDFWMDMMQRNSYCFDVSDILKYVHWDRSLRGKISPIESSKWLRFTYEEEWEGSQKLKLMGVDGPFVCIHSRDSQYLNAIALGKDYAYQNYRDASINNFEQTANYLKKQGIVTIRMGREVKEKVNFKNCIDYANLYYDEFMDIYITGKCKFYMGSDCGLNMLPMAQNKRIALVNCIPVSSPTAGCHPMREDNLLIFKKYYDTKKGRYLTLYEMFEFEGEYKGLRSEDYEKCNIKPVENSAEDILELAIEMNSRIDGTWIETEKDIILQKKYRDTLDFFIKKYNYNKDAVLNYKAGAIFLRKNSFLFADDI